MCIRDSSCYLYAHPDSIDHNYTYIIWTGKEDIWISCYDQYTSKCVFVSRPERIIEKYKDDMDYTDFANGEIRNEDSKIAAARKLLDALQS